ncbi:MAG: YidC/Oxa1 family membrane protein insertase [Bacillota bacterium]
MAGLGELVGSFSKVLQTGLSLFYTWTGNYGFAIIMLTAAIRVVLLPITIMQTSSLQRTAELQPKLEAIKKQYKDQTEQNQKIMELWREHKVNPFSGCLLTLVQLPFFFAMFGALQTYEYAVTPMFLGINLLNREKVVLPILAAVTTYLQVKLTSPPGDRSARSMQLFMPAMIWWFSLGFQAALALYWVAMNVFTVVERIAMTALTRTKAKEAA